MASKPDYRRIYDKFHGSPKAIKERWLRNKARREAEADGRVKKWDGKDVHHKNWINSSKTQVMSKSANRSKPEKSRVKWSKRDKKSWGK
jgi:hypothetical protein